MADRNVWVRAMWLGLLLVGAVSAAEAPRFPEGSVWHQRVDSAALHPQSAAMLARLQALGGWGNSDRLQIDFSFHLRRMTEEEPFSEFPVVQHKAYADYYLPDCEPLGTLMPVPADAAFEGQSGLSCDNTAGDCHLLIERGGLLYELYSGNLLNGELDALCLAVWNMQAVYPEEGRGEHCTSADAAGFPIAPLLPDAEGVADALTQDEGDLGHAIRFILPNARIATDGNLGGTGGRLYVRPASHAGGPSGPADTVPYGVRMRLRADFPMTGYNPAAQAILRTMQRYGMVLADGGNIALTFMSDRHSNNRWSDLGITSQTFFNEAGGAAAVRVTDFEVIDTGPRIAETFDCVRSAVSALGRIYLDGFEGNASPGRR